MTDPLDLIFDKARATPRHIVLAEGDDPRVQAGALAAVRAGIARVTLLGTPQLMAEGLGADPDASTIRCIDAANPPDHTRLSKAYFDLRQHKGATPELADEQVRLALVQAALRVRIGDADGTVAGAVATTADTVRAALQMIGRAEAAPLVSSFFIMVPPNRHPAMTKPVLFADCGLVVKPDAEELAGIARSTAQSWRALFASEPTVAMLSFSTNGSARHAEVERVRSAVAMIREQEPELVVEGEMQFDAAFDDTIRAAKFPGSALTSAPDIYVFPDLNAGNIAYKIAQRIGGMAAIGPILQGLAKPANDLSRGCSAGDVTAAIAITALQVRD
jgi:phosphate acetyltransferase